MIAWTKKESHYVSRCGRFRVENWSDDHSRVWTLFDRDQIVSYKSKPHAVSGNTVGGARPFDRLKDAKAFAGRIVTREGN